MLGKLIKHDFKSLTRILFPTQLAVLAASILGALGISFSMRITDYNYGSFVNLLSALSGLLSGLMILAIIAASFLVAFIIFQRFYKNLMSDEGYLTFTLPITTSQILWSKLITAMIWTIISSVVIFVGVNIFILLCSDGTALFNVEAYRELNRMIHEVFSMFGARLIWPILETILLILVVTANGILQVYLALILGSTVTQKHRILASIGFYFAINMVVSIVSITAQYFMAGSMVNWSVNFDDMVWGPTRAIEAYNYIMAGVQPYYWFTLVMTGAFGAGYFILSRYLLKNKLNLE